MDLSGESLIPAPRDAVWRGLNDPEILRQAIPGCESVDKVSDTEFTAKVVAKVGPVKASFTGAVQLSEIDAPNSYRISGEGKGGVAGFAKGSAFVKLSDSPDGTILSYQVDAQVGGKLAQLGSRLIDGTAKALAQDFFAQFAALITAEQANATPEEIAEAVAEGEIPPPPGIEPSSEVDGAAAMDSTASASRGLPPWIWIAALVAMIGVILAVSIRG